MALKGEKTGVTEKQVFCLSLLPSGRAVRFLKLDTKRMLEATERAAQGIDVDENRTAMAIALSKEIVATCLRGISKGRLEVKFKTDKDDNAAVDVEATLKPAMEADEAFWNDLGYADLIADGPNNMFRLFSDTDDWKALQRRMSAAGGGNKADPFEGKVLMLTA